MPTKTELETEIVKLDCEISKLEAEKSHLKGALNFYAQNFVDNGVRAQKALEELTG